MNDIFESRHQYHDQQKNRQQEKGAAVLIAFLVISIGGYLAMSRFHLRPHQLVELSMYALILVAAMIATVWHFTTVKRRMEDRWPHPPIYIPPMKDYANVRQAHEENAVITGHDIYGKPRHWPDSIRVMQAILFGMLGAGKSTFLRNIIIQDAQRWVGEPGNHHRIPMIIMDGKGDREFLEDLLPALEAAGRLHQLRVLSPSFPDISVRFNLFYAPDGSYQEHVNNVFKSFGLKKDFFEGRQATCLSDTARVLTHTGKLFNIYDIMVMALDERVMREQIRLAQHRIYNRSDVTQQQILNFEMSVHMLLQSLEDAERVPKIQGLLDSLSTFLQDDMSLITGPYEDLITLEDVIDQELILFISLNTMKDSKPIEALGRILLQNLQYIIGKRYEEQQREGRPMVSVILDEFAPFAYPGFARTVQMARGSNTAFLFALQALPQLADVGRGFQQDLSSAPNTIFQMRTKCQETTDFFCNASGPVRRMRRSQSLQRTGWFSKKYQETGFANDTEIKETLALDEHIKNLPTGQMELLTLTKKSETEHAHLHVRVPPDYKMPGFKPDLFPHLKAQLVSSLGANLRFKDATLGRRNARIFGKNTKGKSQPW